MRAHLGVAAPLLAALAALGSLPAVATEPGLPVQARIEGVGGTLWAGEVDAAGTVGFVAYNSDTPYTIRADTPLGVLLRATAAGGLSVAVTDAYLPSDFLVHGIGGAWGTGPWWWDSRVDLVAAYYGDHHGWLENGPALKAGDEVLWYPETTGARPLRLSAGAAAGADAGGAGLVTFLVEWALVDDHHNAGQPWPPRQEWVPAHGARVVGDVTSEAPGGLAAVLLPAGVYSVKAVVRDELYPTDVVRSRAVEVTVP